VCGFSFFSYIYWKLSFIFRFLSSVCFCFIFFVFSLQLYPQLHHAHCIHTFLILAVCNINDALPCHGSFCPLFLLLFLVLIVCISHVFNLVSNRIPLFPFISLSSLYGKLPVMCTIGFFSLLPIMIA
jgi:hypothetical protein